MNEKSPDKSIGDSPKCSEPARTIRMPVDIPAHYSFSVAVHAVTVNNERITRAGWNAPGQFVYALLPKEGARLSPYLMLLNAQGYHVPWTPSQGDLFANDWAILPA